MALLELKGVSLLTSGVERVASVTASVDAGQLVAIVGPNGSGKSSLLGLMAGLLTPTRGSVLLDGRLVSSMGLRELATQRAWLGQSTPGADNFTVAEVLNWGRSFAAGETSDAQSALDEVVEVFEVQDLMTARLHRLSGGQRQRVHLARIWLQGARITLLDEPDSSLDETGRSMLRGAVQECVRAGRTVVLVTHDRGWAMSEADLVWEVCAGRIVVG